MDVHMMAMILMMLTQVYMKEHHVQEHVILVQHMMQAVHVQEEATLAALEAAHVSLHEPRF